MSPVIADKSEKSSFNKEFQTVIEKKKELLSFLPSFLTIYWMCLLSWFLLFHFKLL